MFFCACRSVFPRLLICKTFASWWRAIKVFYNDAFRLGMERHRICGIEQIFSSVYICIIQYNIIYLLFLDLLATTFYTLLFHVNTNSYLLLYVAFICIYILYTFNKDVHNYKTIQLIKSQLVMPPVNFICGIVLIVFGFLQWLLAWTSVAIFSVLCIYLIVNGWFWKYIRVFIIYFISKFIFLRNFVRFLATHMHLTPWHWTGFILCLCCLL